MLKKYHFIRLSSYGIVLFLFLMQNAWAVDQFNNGRVHGFIMQSFLKTDKNNFLGSLSKNGSFDYTEIGLNASARWRSKTFLAGQVLSRRAGETDDGSLKLDFALIDHRFYQKNGMTFGFRLGRVKNPIGFYNETRDVSFTRENIILPQSIYFERTRDVSLSSDGVHLFGFSQNKSGLFKSKIVLVRPRASDLNTEYALFGSERPGRIEGEFSSGAQLEYQSNDRQFRLLLSNVNLNMKYFAGANEVGIFNPTVNVQDDTIKFTMNILSVQYNIQKWSFTGEYAFRKLDYADSFDNVLLPSLLNHATGESYYLQSVYRVNGKINLIARYDALFTDKQDKDGAEFESIMTSYGATVPSHSRFAKDVMIGGQYNFNWRWMIRLEYHTVNGTAWLPARENENTSDLSQRWRMVSASMSYRF